MPPILPLGSLKLPDDYIPSTKPPSARHPESRKAQLLRTYTALIRSTPLMLFFQHNNITAPEFAAIRGELRRALAQVPSAPVAEPVGNLPAKTVADYIQLLVLRTNMFNVAFKIVEFFDADAQPQMMMMRLMMSNAYSHDLSRSAYEAVKGADEERDMTGTAYGQLRGLLSGPIAAVTFPAISPEHVAAVLRVLAPTSPAFPPPPRKKKKNTAYYHQTTQNGLQKLLLVGGRIEGRVFDADGVKWVGGIEGGLDGLRGQLVTMLQRAGLGLTTALEGHGKGLWLTLESRRTQLEEEHNDGQNEQTG